MLRDHWISVLISLFVIGVMSLPDAGKIADPNDPVLASDINDKLGINDFDYNDHSGNFNGIIVEEISFDEPDYDNQNNAEVDIFEELDTESIEKEDIVKSASESDLANDTDVKIEQPLSANSAPEEEGKPALGAPIPQVTGCKTQGQVALTYSEGPSDVTAKIVRHLTKAEAKANFFVNATWLNTQQYAMVLQNIYKAGHFIGMSYRVKNDNPATMSDEEIKQDIIDNAYTIESVINIAPKYVRLHYTDVKDVRTESLLQELGFVVVGYNLDSQDYQKKETSGPGSIQEVYSETFKRYKDTYDVKGSFISIQYDLPYTGSLNAVPYIVNTIDEEGYTMVRLDGCLNDPNPYKKHANTTEYVNDKYSYNQADYRQGQKPVAMDIAANVAHEIENELIDAKAELNGATVQKISWVASLTIISSLFYLF